MGRGRKGGKHRGGRQENGSGDKPEYRPREDFVVEKKNKRFETYYKTQRILPESEWEAFMESLREALPTTFRLAGNRTTAHDLNMVIKETYVPQLTGITWEDQPVPAPTQLSWYPDHLAWQLNVKKTIIRKSPEFRKFQNFLVYETQSGNISRQEAVSMIPPLILDVESHHTVRDFDIYLDADLSSSKVLDMCAAPGSKTAQLIEALHTGTDMPSGIVIANDSDYKRSYMLVHQSARLPSPSLMVTNLDASLFPSLKLPPSSLRLKVQKDPGFGTIPTTGKGKGRTNTLLFDRILCDVPCSGDGTIRKNLQLWNSWQPNNATGIHVLQLRILLRGMRLLAPAGRLVYSTCSLNPIENEAVLAAALNQYPGEFEILDVSSRLPGLERRPGLVEWSIAIDKGLNTFVKTWEEYQSHWTADEKAKGQARYAQTIFSPLNVRELGLEHCLRIYPHLQDTGGFFIALLARKKVPEPESLTSLKRTASNLSGVVIAGNSKKVKTEEGISSPLASCSLLGPTTDVPPPPTEDPDAELEEELPEVDVAALQEPIKVIGEDGEEKATKPTEGGKSFNEVPFIYLKEDNEHVQKCLSVTHVDPHKFPSSQLFARSATSEIGTERPKSLYFSNALVKDIIQCSDYKRLRLINAGVKVFVRQEGALARASGGGAEEAHAKSPYRFVSDGIHIVLPYVNETDGIIDVSLRELKLMLQLYYPVVAKYHEEFRDRIKSKAPGSYLVRFLPGEWEGYSLRHTILLPLWISQKSTALMADKHTKSALCLRVFGEDFTPSGKEEHLKKQKKNSEDIIEDTGGVISVEV